jgi:phage baseplate assembly protein W
MPIEIKTKINRKYQDIDMDMLVHPLTDDLIVRSNIDAINGSIMNIIKTKKGERVFQPDFGSTIYNSLFEPMNSQTRIVLEAQIENALNQHEPRININEIKVVAKPDENGYEVYISYVPNNEKTLAELEFFLKRLR